jgi:curved DNA-binding protein CbpA
MSLVFGSLSRRGFSGVLTIDAGGQRYRVGWHEGAVIAGESAHPADSVVKLAITLGMITSTQAGAVSQALAAASERDELGVLAEVTGLAPDVLARLARRLVGARAARALAPVEGEFIVTDEVPAGAGVVPIDARWILYTGIRHHFTLERLAREVTGLASSIRLRADADLGGFGFGVAEEGVLARLQDGELLLAPTPAGLDVQLVHAVALALIATGEAEIASGPAAQPATSGASAPAAPAPRESAVHATVPPPSADARATVPPPSAHARATVPPPSAHARVTVPPPSAPQPDGSPPAPLVSRTGTPMKLPPMVSRTATPLANQFTPTGTPTGHGRPTPPPHDAVAPRATSRTATGPIPTAATPRTTGPVPTVPVKSRTGTGPVPRSAVPRKRNPLADDAPAIRELIAERTAMLDAEADHYTLLGIDRAADANAIRAAYFELARLLHPDRLASLGIADDDRTAQRLFARINDSFTVLSTTTRRAEYDTLLDAGGARAVSEREAAASAAVQAAVEAEERYRLGEMAMRRQQADIAVHEFQRAVELKPDEPDYMALLGWALYVAARDKVAALTVARAHLNKALSMKKETALPHLYLGRIARMEGEDDEAARAFRLALEIAPGNSEAQAELRVVEARRRARPSTRGGLFSRLGKKP